MYFGCNGISDELVGQCVRERREDVRGGVKKRVEEKIMFVKGRRVDSRC